MGRFFKIRQNWLKLKKILDKNGNFSKFGPKLGRLVYEWVTFSWKTGICMGLFSNSVAAHPYQNQTWVPPGMHSTADPWLTTRKPYCMLSNYVQASVCHMKYYWELVFAGNGIGIEINKNVCSDDSSTLCELKGTCILSPKHFKWKRWHVGMNHVPPEWFLMQAYSHWN